MSQPIIFNKSRFYQWGKKAPHPSRYKGIMDADALIGLKNYTDREDKQISQNDVIDDLDLDNEFENQSKKEADSFWDYTNRGEMMKAGLFSSFGVLKNEDEVNAFKEKIRKTFSQEGRLAWQFITSLPSHEIAKDLGLNSFTDFYQVTSNAFEKWSRHSGFKTKHLVWWANVHVDTDNPHVHLIFTTDDPGVKRGKLKETDLDNFKITYLDEIEKLNKMKNTFSDSKVNQDIFKSKDVLKKNLIQQSKIVVNSDSSLEDDFYKLATLLPKQGRLQINSKQKSMDIIRPVVYQMVDKVLSHPDVSKQMNSFNNHLKQFDDKYQKEINVDTTRMQDSENKKIKDQIANHILDQCKENKHLYDSYTDLTEFEMSEFDEFEKAFNEHNTLNLQQNPFSALTLMKDNLFKPSFRDIHFENDLDKFSTKLQKTQNMTDEVLELHINNRIDLGLKFKDGEEVELYFSRYDGSNIINSNNGDLRLSEVFSKKNEAVDFNTLNPNYFLCMNGHLKERESDIRFTFQKRPYAQILLPKEKVIDSEKYFSLLKLDETNLLARSNKRYFVLNQQSLNQTYHDRSRWTSYSLPKGIKESETTAAFIEAKKEAARLHTDEQHDLFKSKLLYNQHEKRIQQINRKLARGSIRSTLSFVNKAQAEAERKMEEYLEGNQEQYVNQAS